MKKAFQTVKTGLYGESSLRGKLADLSCQVSHRFSLCGNNHFHKPAFIVVPGDVYIYIITQSKKDTSKRWSFGTSY